MKQSVYKIAITALLLFMLHGAYAQIKNLHDKAHKIPDSLLQQKIIGTDTVIYIPESMLKEKYNVAGLKDEKFLYIEYKNGYVRGITIGDTAGRILTSVMFQKQLYEEKGLEFSTCYCVGKESCEEMFSKKGWPNDKICVGNTCIATRPFNPKEELKKLKEQKKGN